MDMNADVTRLLQILAATSSTANPALQATQLPPAAPPQQQQQQQYQQYLNFQKPPQNAAAQDPRRVQNNSGYPHSSTPPPLRTTTPPGPVPPTQNVEPPKEAARVDPRSITDWSTALKFVMKTLVRDEAVMAKIRKELLQMKKHQHEHEKMWWAGREDIVKKHAARVESSKKVEALLRNLGNISGQQPTNLPTLQDEKEELTVYDAKVHLRSEDMVKHMAVELGQMGVPFFCGGPVETKQDGEGVEELRKRMVELLDDLSTED